MCKKTRNNQLIDAPRFMVDKAREQSVCSNDVVMLPIESLEDMVEKCCANTPDRYEVRLCMEEGAAWVELWLDDVHKLELPDAADKTLLEQLNDAICVANGWAT